MIVHTNVIIFSLVLAGFWSQMKSWSYPSYTSFKSFSRFQNTQQSWSYLFGPGPTKRSYLRPSFRNIDTICLFKDYVAQFRLPMSNIWSRHALPRLLKRGEAGIITFTLFILLRPVFSAARRFASRLRFFNNDFSLDASNVCIASLGGNEDLTNFRTSRLNMDELSTTSPTLSPCTESSRHKPLFICLCTVHSACSFLKILPFLYFPSSSVSYTEDYAEATFEENMNVFTDLRLWTVL